MVLSSSPVVVNSVSFDFAQSVLDSRLSSWDRKLTAGRWQRAA